MAAAAQQCYCYLYLVFCIAWVEIGNFPLLATVGILYIQVGRPGGRREWRSRTEGWLICAGGCCPTTGSSQTTASRRSWAQASTPWISRWVRVKSKINQTVTVNVKKSEYYIRQGALHCKSNTLSRLCRENLIWRLVRLMVFGRFENFRIANFRKFGNQFEKLLAS
jgi:hypothetical protein